MNAPRFILIGFVHAYRWLVSPLKSMVTGSTGCCRFSPTCSGYALDALRVHGAIRGSLLAARRILRCHPWGGAGHDPVPESKR